MTHGETAGWLRRVFNVRAGEAAALIWSCAYFFFVLSAYYVLRPIRDEAGVAGGVNVNLALMFSFTLLGTMLLHPLYTAAVGRYPRRRFVPLAYRFFILNLVIFWALYRVVDPSQSVWIGRVFFVWTSVFNLFVVSVFWSFMADLYRPTQSRRLFGMVAIGGTLGAMTGAGITASLVTVVGPINLLLVSAAIIELATQASNVLDRHEAKLRRAGEDDDAPDAPRSAAESRRDEVIGGRVLDGIRHVLRSPYLLGIAALMLFFTVASTFLYFQQLDIVSRTITDDPARRTQIFGLRDVATNFLTLMAQAFLTGRILRWFGVGVALAFLPVVTFIGFGVLAAAPVLVVVIAFDVLRRAGNFAIQRPAREALYTVLPRTDKFKAKNFNDTFVYRLGDQLGAWSYPGLAWLGLTLSALSFTMLPLSLGWFALAFWLGRQYAARERGTVSPPDAGTPSAGSPATRDPSVATGGAGQRPFRPL
ncbi:MAG TPA: MFS transporter [Gemmatimonadaceae bacterium]|nr:MFS transporter [Gemmatimonadaceae bacterium]